MEFASNTLAKDLQASAVHGQMDRLVTLGDGLSRHLQPIAATRQSGEIRYRDFNPEQFGNAPHKALRLTQRLLENDAQSETKFNR